MLFKFFITSFCFILFFANSFAQESDRDTTKGRFVSATIDQNGDTLPRVFLNYYYVWAKRSFPDKKEERKYNKLEKNVRIVYPYAKKASQLLLKYKSEMDTITNERVKKKYYKKIEEELWTEYGDELQNMTVSQGRILIKLVDRETDKTSYELVKEMRSGFTAFVFQGMARMFGHNLKSEYNAFQQDKYIEEIILAIEVNKI